MFPRGLDYAILLNILKRRIYETRLSSLFCGFISIFIFLSLLVFSQKDSFSRIGFFFSIFTFPFLWFFSQNGFFSQLGLY